MLPDWIKTFNLNIKEKDVKPKGRISLDQYLSKLNEENIQNSVERKVNTKIKILEILNSYVKEASDKGFTISYLNIIKNVHVPEIKLTSGFDTFAYFEYEGFACSVNDVGDIYVY